MVMETMSLIPIQPELYSMSKTAEDNFFEEPPNKEIVAQYLAGASPVTHPRYKDRMVRLIEIARILLHDFGLNRNDAYDVMATFNQSHVRPSFDDDSLKKIIEIAADHWTDKQPGWRLYADTTHLSGEYDINSHSYILPLNNPSVVAKAFLRLRCSTHGMLRIRFFQGKYWEWDGSHYIKADESKVRCRLEDFLEMALAYSDKGYESFPTRKKYMDDIMDSVQRMISLSDDISLPYFMGNGKPPEATDTLIFGRTQTLRLSDRTVSDSEPYWFSTGTLDLDPDPYAPKPIEWNKFLDSVFEKDQMSKDLLHEFMGLIVSGNINFQKILLMFGATRSGKGTITGVMEKLVGLGNYCALTVNQLSDKFGLGNLPGKKLIMMNEVYFGNKPSDKKTVDRILSMIGGDTFVTEKKYKDSISARIGGLFVMSTNELPDLANIGSALSARLLPLVFSKSFAGSEDVNLEAKLKNELPGILNQALDGLERLLARGRFVLPPSSEEMLSRMRKRFDPLAEFIKEKCNRQGRCSVNQFQDAYNRWRAQEDMGPMTVQILGRELDNYSGIKIRQGKEGRFYEGVELK